MKDNLARKTYAQKIAEEISEHYDSELKDFNDGKKKDRENIVFAISGKWGEGKTALLNLLDEPLTQKGFRIIRFNPWKYSQEDITLKRAFLCSVREQLSSGVDLDDLYFDRTKTSIDFNWRLVVKYTVFTAFFYFLILPSIFGFSLTEWLETINAIFHSLIDHSLIKVFLSLVLIPVVLQLITISRRSANVSTAEEFEKKFEDLLRFRSKLVIFVDDLDRCSPKTVKIILDSLRTFFQHPECSYIITGDHTVVERYAGDELELPDEVSSQQKLQEGRRFLKKLFDVYWRLPLPTPYQFGIFVDDEMKSSKLTLNEQQSLNVKSFLIDNDLFERNPRHVKRFLTKLRFAIEGVKLQKEDINSKSDISLNATREALGDILANPDLLAKVLLFEEFFYPIYEKLILNPEELINHEKALRGVLNPIHLKIKDKLVSSLLDKKNDDQEGLERYAGLVRRTPQFSDADNSTLHEVADYFSFSGSTGLPSVMGPDESNFDQYLKTGQLSEKLGAVLAVSKKEKKDVFVEKALGALVAATDVDKGNIVGEGIKLSQKLDEWADKFDEWYKAFLTLPAEKQKSLSAVFWTVVLEKKPGFISKTNTENPMCVEYLWEILKSSDRASYHSDSIAELEKLLLNFIRPEFLNLKGVEVYLEKVDSKNIKDEIEKLLDNPTICRTYLDHLQSIGLPEGKITLLTKNKLRLLLSDFANFDWAISNADYLKTLGIFEVVKMNLGKWSKDSKQLLKIADNQSVFDLSLEDKEVLAKDTIGLLKKSEDLSFLANFNIQLLLDRENKKDVFKSLRLILSDSDESLEKRKNSASLLLKGDSFWNGIELNDVYEHLKSIKKLKISKPTELTDKPKEILESWGYSEEGEDQKDKEGGLVI